MSTLNVLVNAAHGSAKKLGAHMTRCVICKSGQAARNCSTYVRLQKIAADAQKRLKHFLDTQKKRTVSEGSFDA